MNNDLKLLGDISQDELVELVKFSAPDCRWELHLNKDGLYIHQKSDDNKEAIKRLTKLRDQAESKILKLFIN